MNIAIIPSRGKNKLIQDKNLHKVGELPLIGHVIKAAGEASLIGDVFVATNCPKITEYVKSQNCKIITLPDEYCSDDYHYHDVLKYSVDFVVREKEKAGEKVDNIVILLGNTAMVNNKVIDKALRILEEKKDIDSVMSVWQAIDDHPMRALEIQDGFLVPHGIAAENKEISVSRKTYKPVYFYDQGIWAFRKECVHNADGPRPWYWMGKKCYPLIRTWIGGRDVHNILDLAISEWWLGLSDEEKERFESSPIF